MHQCVQCIRRKEKTLTNKKLHQHISKNKKIKMVMSKHLTHFCYPTRLVLHQHLKSHVAYPGIPREINYSISDCVVCFLKTYRLY